MATNHHDGASSVTAKSAGSRAQARWFGAAVFLFTAFALFLRFYRIGAFELWLDEAYTFRQMVVSDWLSSYLADNSPPFYNLLMRGWGHLAGYSEASLRAPSALCGGLFVGVAMLAGRSFFDRRTGYWCGAFAALAPIQLYYSQEARNYTLLTLLLLLTWLLLWRAQRSMAWRDWLAAAGCALFALFTHYMAALALPPTILAVLLWPQRQTLGTRLRRYLGLAAAALLPATIWIAWSFALTDHSLTGLNWMTSVWRQTPPALAPLRSIEAFSFLTGPHLLLSMGGFARYQQFLGEHVRWALRLLIAATLLWACLPGGDRALGLAHLGRRKAVLLAAVLVPLLTLWAVSLIRPLYIVSRYDLIAFPAFVLLLGFAFAKLQAQGRRGLWAALLLGGLYLLPLGVFAFEFCRIPAPQRHRPTAQLLAEQVREGDVVVFTGNRSFVTRFYLNRLGYRCEKGLCENPASGHRFPYRQYPTANEDEEAVYNRSEILEDTGRAREELDEFLSMRSDARATLWLVVRGRLEDDQIMVRFRPDLILLDTIAASSMHCTAASDELFVLACTTPSGY